MVPTDPINATFAALAHPTRRALLARLAKGDANVTELAKPFRMTQPAISKHLKVLEHAGLISRTRVSQSHFCKLEAARLKDVTQWIDNFRGFWDASFDRLDEFLVEMKEKEATHERAK